MKQRISRNEQQADTDTDQGTGGHATPKFCISRGINNLDLFNSHCFFLVEKHRNNFSLNNVKNGAPKCEFNRQFTMSHQSCHNLDQTFFNGDSEEKSAAVNIQRFDTRVKNDASQ
jgi:hypothetical protein